MDFFSIVGLLTCFYFIILLMSSWYFDCNFELALAEKFGKKLVKLKGKVTWITDPTTELGRMLAIKIAENNGKLVLSSTSVKELKYLKMGCLNSNPLLMHSDILLLNFDIASVMGHKHYFNKVIRHFGVLDIIIFNHDQRQKGLWESISVRTDLQMFQTNVFGGLALSKVVVKYFSFKNKGRIAIVSSLGGLIGVPHSSTYSGTKHALHGYYNSLRFEKLEDKIHITLLCPGSNVSLKRKMFDTDYKGAELTSNTTKHVKKVAERYAHLSLIAIINNLEEVWMTTFPILPLIYGIKYYPNFTKYILKYFKENK